MTSISARAIARNALSYFQTKTRQSGETFHCLKDGKPDWVQDLVRHAHDGMLPDDFRYGIIKDCLDAIADGIEDDLEPEHKHYILCQWLGSHGKRHEYVNEAASDYSGDIDIMELLQAGYALELMEVTALLIDKLEEIADEQTDEEE
jgi:hypothetical protein